MKKFQYSTVVYLSAKKTRGRYLNLQPPPSVFYIPQWQIEPIVFYSTVILPVLTPNLLQRAVTLTLLPFFKSKATSSTCESFET